MCYQNIAWMILISLISFSCQNQEQDIAQESHPETVSVKVQKVALSEGTSNTLKYSGNIEAKNTTHLSFQVPGKVVQVVVDMGSNVQKGQILASLDKVEYQSNLEISTSQVQLAQDAFNRLEKLHKNKSIPEQQYIEAKLKLTQAKAQQTIAKKQLADTDLKASFSGTISTKMIEEGMMVGPTAPAFQVVNLNTVYVVIAVPETEVAHLKVGDMAQVSVEAVQAKNIQARVALVSPVADPVSRTFQVKLEVNNSLQLKQGMLATVEFSSKTTLQPAKEVVIPITALLKSTELGNYVFVLHKNDKVKAVKVMVGKFMDGGVTIQSGLQGTEQIVIAGQHKLKDGSKVRI